MDKIRQLPLVAQIGIIAGLLLFCSVCGFFVARPDKWLASLGKPEQPSLATQVAAAASATAQARSKTPLAVALEATATALAANGLSEPTGGIPVAQGTFTTTPRVTATLLSSDFVRATNTVPPSPTVGSATPFIPPATRSVLAVTQTAAAPTAVSSPTPTDIPSIVVVNQPTLLAQPLFSPSEKIFPAEAAGAVVASPPSIGITPDGLNGEWARDETWYPSAFLIETQNFSNRADALGLWRVYWDANYLYLLVHVYDDAHVQVSNSNEIYRGDSIEIEIDANLKDGKTVTDSNDNTYQIIVSPGNFNDLPAKVSRYRGQRLGKEAEEFNHTILAGSGKTKDGYILEVAIPWSEIHIMPKAGLELGFALSVNDVDTAESLEVEATYSNAWQRQWRKPDSWGTLKLQ